MVYSYRAFGGFVCGLYPDVPAAAGSWKSEGEDKFMHQQSFTEWTGQGKTVMSDLLHRESGKTTEIPLRGRK